MRLRALDGWRGIACLLVAIHHFPAPHALYYESWLRNGAPMLELFFLISGFVVSLVFADMAQRPRGAAAFMMRVLGRVWPLHVVMLAALVVLVLLRMAFADQGGFRDQMTIEALGAQVLLIQTWVGVGLSWNFPAWTLSAELAAYLLFAVLVMATRSQAGRVIGALALTLMAGVVFLGELGPREHYNVISVARVVTGFFIGFLLREVWQARPLRAGWWTTVLELAAVAGAIWAMSARLDGAAYMLNYAIFGFLVYVFAGDHGAVSRLLASGPLQWLGKVSFSIYMLHGVILLYLEQAFWTLERFSGVAVQFWLYNPHIGRTHPVFSLGAGWADDMLLVAYLALVLAGGALVYQTIEEPTRQAAAALSKRLYRGRAAVSAPPAPGRPVGWLG